MAHSDNEGLTQHSSGQDSHTTYLDAYMAEAGQVHVPDAAFVKDASFSRDGMDLVLDQGGQSMIIENYFAQTEAPSLVAPDGSTLSPTLVQSFLSVNPVYASADSLYANDASPVGAVHEISGQANVTRAANGLTEPLQSGTPIYQGDIIETSDNGAVNIMFIDETSLAVSEDARMAIDEYVFDPATSGGISNFSVLKGVFVYTSGLIGREDPDDVKIETPSGSIGIRGTIIAANVDTGEVTVVEGAIVLSDHAGNQMTLAAQYETARFDAQNGVIQHIGQLPAAELAANYQTLAGVSGTLFSSIAYNASAPQSIPDHATGSQQMDQNNDHAVDGTLDQDGDGSVDASVPSQNGAASDSATENDTKTGDEHSSAGDSAQDKAPSSTTEQDTHTNDFTPTKFGGANTLGTPTGTSTADHASGAHGVDGVGAAATSGEGTGISAGLSNLSSQNPQAGNNSENGEASSQSSGTLQSDIYNDGSHYTGAPPQNGNNAAPPSTSPTNPPTNPPGGGGTVTPPTPFAITLTPLSVDEHIMGANVAQISSTNGTLAHVTLSGTYSSLFEFVPIDGNNGYIRLASGADLDYETLPFLDLQVTAANLDNSETDTQNLTISVSDTNEAPIALDSVSQPMLSATQGMSWSYNFADDFHDVDFGDTLNFSYIIRDSGGNTLFDSSDVNPSLIAASHASFGADGQVSLTFMNSFSAILPDGNFSIAVSVVDSQGAQAYSTYNFELHESQSTLDQQDSAAIVSSGDNIYAGLLADDNVLISGNNNQIFMSHNDNGNIVLEGNTNSIHLMDGHDSITIEASAAENTISGGNGNDTFFIMNAGNKFYGDNGADTFMMDMSQDLFSQMNATISIIDGGNSGSSQIRINHTGSAHNGLAAHSISGNGDVLAFTDGSYGDTLDFSNVSQFIENIETINLENNQANHVLLNYSDVLNMTDDNGILMIRGDNLDSMIFDSQGQELLQGEQVTHSDTGEVFDVYFFGEVTILVDTDMSAVMA